MIGSKKGGTLNLLFAIIIVLILFGFTFWFVEEIRYSWKINKELNNHNATCYLDRGVFKLPVAKVCTYNKTLVIERTPFGWFVE